jgi:hypothetical protein
MLVISATRSDAVRSIEGTESSINSYDQNKIAKTPYGPLAPTLHPISVD